MNFKLLSALLLLSVFVVACGDDDSAPSLNYPITATFSAITDQGDMQIFVNDGGSVVELSADATTADNDEVFDDLSDGWAFTTYEFMSATEVTIIDLDPGFEDTSMANMVLGNDMFTLSQDFGGATFSFNFEGDPTDFKSPGSAYAWYSSDGFFDITANGVQIETLDDLKAGLEVGDTLAYVSYNANFKE